MPAAGNTLNFWNLGQETRYSGPIDRRYLRDALASSVSLADMLSTGQRVWGRMCLAILFHSDAD